MTNIVKFAATEDSASFMPSWPLSTLGTPLKIHICEHPLRGLPAYPNSSLPQRREPSQINKLCSRLCGSDEFLEVPLKPQFFVFWQNVESYG